MKKKERLDQILNIKKSQAVLERLVNWKLISPEEKKQIELLNQKSLGN